MHALCFYKQSPKVELDQTNTSKSIGVMQTFINTHPGSPRIKEATEIIDKCRAKLEAKGITELLNCILTLDSTGLQRFAYNDLLNNYPESQAGDEYKLKSIKSYYKFAKLSEYR